jgi:hypothetical protein
VLAAFLGFFLIRLQRLVQQRNRPGRRTYGI